MIAFHKSGSLRRDIKRLKGLLIRRLAAHSAQYCTLSIKTGSPAPETSSVNRNLKFMITGHFTLYYKWKLIFFFTVKQQLCTRFNTIFFHCTSIVVAACQVYFFLAHFISCLSWGREKCKSETERLSGSRDWARPRRYGNSPSPSGRRSSTSWSRGRL